MSDSTLHIGTLASNNVNNIVNDTSKYDEYKEKVKELEKELQTRKDTFEKMTEPLVYVCDCYQKFNVVTGMPKSTFGDSFGYAMQKEISDYMQDFYAGKVSREDLDSYFEKCCTSLRTYRTGQHQTSGTNEADNTQIVSEMYEVFAKENARAAGQANYQEGKAWNEKYYSDYRGARNASYGRAPEHRKIAVQFGFGVTYRIDHFDRRDAPEIELGTKRHVRTEIVVAERIGLKSQSVSLRINEHGKVRVGHGLIGSNWKTARSGRRTTAQFLFLREKTPELRSSIRRSPGFHCLSSGKTESGRRSRRSLAFSAAPIVQNATNAPSPARCLDLFVGDRPFLSGAHAAGFRSKVPAGSAVRSRPSRQGDRAAPRAAELFQSGSTCEIAQISPHAPQCRAPCAPQDRLLRRTRQRVRRRR